MPKTILITGATDGIGRLAAKLFVDEGHKVLLHGRNAEKLGVVAAELGGCETYQADLSDLEATRKMAADVLDDHDSLDVLINNAGVLKTPAPVGPNGMDVRFVVNTLAPYVLARALLGIMGPQGRIINLSSAAQAPVNIAALRGQARLDDMGAYAQSKLAITIWSREMARALPDGPAVIAVNPGSLLASKMVKEGFGIEGNDLMIGADILRKAALSEEFATASGQYFDNDAGRFAEPNAAALDAQHASDVMAAIEDMVGV